MKILEIFLIPFSNGKSNIQEIPRCVIAKFHIRFSFLPVCLFLAFGVFGLHPAFGQFSFADVRGGALQISGRYTDVYRNGAPAETNNFHFVALTASDGWSISATNENDPKDWCLMRYDGTNIYVLNSDPGYKGHRNPYEIYGYVYPGEFYFPQGPDSVHLFFPWMVFHLTPQMIQQRFEKNGVIVMPWPWSARYSLFDYGFQWKIQSFEKSVVIQKIEVVRDSALDLKTDEEELRRANLDYPFSYSSLEHRLETLQFRKNIPDGFIGATYECGAVYQTNGWQFPTKARFTDYHPGRILNDITLQVDQVELLQNGGIQKAVPPAETHVFDYRYQRANNQTKFNKAEYILKAGDSFPSGNDPKLLAQARDWLEHGLGYNNTRTSRTWILVGMLTITLIFIGFSVFRLRMNKRA